MKKTEDLTRANELQREAEEWVNKTFNFIQVNVLEKMCDNMLFEYIRQTEPDYEEFINNYNLHSELLEHIQENFDDVSEDINLFAEETFEDEIKFFCEELEQNSFDDWRSEREGENYPMWNTCFEFRYDPTEEIIQACVDAGFGIIEGMDDFNTLLFVAGAGYSFYGQHWIPAYLNMPWNDKKREANKDLNYSMV